MEFFADHVKRLYEAREWSQARLVREASGYDIPGTSPDTVRNAVSIKRRNPWPSAAVIEAIARALSVDPFVFDAYRIARAAQLLDPAHAGAEAALANAELILSRSAVASLVAAADRSAARHGETPPKPAANPQRKRQKGQGA